MSLQLILFPQSFDGVSTLVAPTEYISNAIEWNALNQSVSNTSTVAADGTLQGTKNVITQVLNSHPPNIPNTWYRFKANPLTPSFPIGGFAGGLKECIFEGPLSGIYQKLTNVPFPFVYNIAITNGGTNSYHTNFFYALYDNLGNQLWFHQITGAPPSITVIPVPFVNLAHSEVTLVVCYYDTIITGSTTNSLRQISMTAPGEVLGASLSNGQVICDLYQEEEMPLTLSIDEFKNAAEQIQSATKRNNQIFENLFNVTRTNIQTSPMTFNASAQTRCEIKQDGLILFEGYLKMIDIQDKEGEISYNVNIYSEVITLAELLEGKKFSDIDLSELTHEYDKDSIKDSWNTNGLELTNNLPIGSYAGTSGQKFTDVLKYPFVDWTHQILIADGSTGSNATLDNLELTSLEQAFRPWIKIKYLIDRIFEATPFSYTSNFFNTTDFKKLFMDFNWGASENPFEAQEEMGGSYIMYYFSSFGDGSGINEATTSFTPLHLVYNIQYNNNPNGPPNYDNATNIITSTVTSETYTISYDYILKNTTNTSEVIECRWLHSVDGALEQVTVNVDPLSTYHYQGYFTTTLLNPGTTLGAQFKQTNGGSIVRQLETTFPSQGAFVTFVVSMTSRFLFGFIQSLRGDLEQWQFLKGILTMFNLVCMPDKSNPNNIIIEPYKDMFLENSDSKELDWTEKVDVTEMTLKPLTDLKKETIFKFEEDEDDYPFENYKRSVQGFLYGSQSFAADTTTGNLPTVFEGTEEIVATPFAATIPKPYDANLFPDFITPAIYSYNADDGTSEGFANAPRIMYNNGTKTLSTNSYYIPPQNDKASENQSTFLQFSHLTDVPALSTSSDFHFGICQLLQGLGAAPVDNLFNTYWLPYFNELYNPDTRIMTLKVNLTPGDINTFNFYDTVFIRNRTFRVNKISYNPNDLSIIEFILIP